MKHRNTILVILITVWTIWGLGLGATSGKGPEELNWRQVVVGGPAVWFCSSAAKFVQASRGWFDNL